jgi:MFS family permease
MFSEGKNGMRLMLSTVALITLMCGLDGSVINVALPSIAKDFGIDAGTASWVTISYFVMMAGLLLIFARVAKNRGIKKVLLAGVVLFTVSSLMCGVSPNFEFLLFSRILQGTGAAMMASAAPMVCVRHLPAEKLAGGLAVLTIGSSLGFTLGPAVGGLFVDLHSWHWIFLINVPIGIASSALILRSIPKDSDCVGDRPDYIGAAFLMLSFLFGVLVLEGNALFVNMTPLFGILFLVFITLFAVNELKTEKPLLNVRIFGNIKFDSAYVSFILDNVGYMGLMYIIPFFMIVCLGMSYAMSGAVLLIPSLLTLFTCIPIARWSDIHGRWLPCMISVTAIMLASLVLYIWAEEVSYIPIIAAVTLMGISWAFYGGPMMGRVVETVRGESKDMASSLMNEGTYTGSVLGTTSFALMFTIGAGTGNVGLGDLTRDAFLDGMAVALVFGVIVGLVAMFLSGIVKDTK